MTQLKIFAVNVARQRYLIRNGGIEKICNDMNKKIKYEKFLAKLINKNISWTQKKISKM